MRILCRREGGSRPLCNGLASATARAATTPLVASEPKSGSECSAGGSGTQRYVWNPYGSETERKDYCNSRGSRIPRRFRGRAGGEPEVEGVAAGRCG
jgi:hypothetical protein